MKIKNLSLTLVSVLVLSACGGGGSGGSSASPSPQSSQPETAISSSNSNSSSTPPTVQTEPPVVENEGRKPAPSVDSGNKKPMLPVENGKPNNPPPPEPMVDNYADAKVVERLGLTRYDFGEIELEGKTFKLVPVKNIEVTNQKLETLRDSEGKLIGYTGYARTINKQNSNFENKEESSYLAFFKADSTQKVQPTQDVTYSGSMYYAYNDVKQALEGTVAATYSGANKTASMKITPASQDRENVVWELWGVRKGEPVAVVDGEITGKLYPEGKDNKESNGVFSGAFYGKSGEMLLGEAYNDNPNRESKNWKGVVKAEAVRQANNP